MPNYEAELTFALKARMLRHAQTYGIGLSKILLKNVVSVKCDQKHQESTKVVELSVKWVLPDSRWVIQEAGDVIPVCLKGLCFRGSSYSVTN